MEQVTQLRISDHARNNLTDGNETTGAYEVSFSHMFTSTRKLAAPKMRYDAS